MNLFEFFRNRRPSDITPAQILKRLVDCLPDVYKTHRQYVNCVEYLVHHEWELALDSLIELAEETGDHFSNEHWQDLADAAAKMDLTRKVDYCKGQIRLNEREHASYLPLGCTNEKSEDVNIVHVSKSFADQKAIERRENDKVHVLASTDGVHVTYHCKGGFLYIVERGNVTEAGFELGVNGFIVDVAHLTAWVLPSVVPLTVQEKEDVKRAIIRWGEDKNVRMEFL